MRKILHYLERTALACLFILITSTTYSQTVTPPSVGDGSESNPYEIATLENLYWLSQNSTEWDKHYIQIADIDASTTVGWDSGAGFTPIGNSTHFIGNYNGDRHTIDELFINRPELDGVGLFGVVGENGQIVNLGVVNANIIGRKYVSALVGNLYKGTVNNCSSTGTCYSNTSTTWWNAVGGLVGINNGNINFSYSSANVSSTYDRVGGLVGANEGIIKRCYALGDVTGSSRVGGLAGDNSDLIENSYSIGSITCGGTTGGLVGYSNSGTVNASFWDTEKSGQSSSDGGSGLTTVEMKKPVNYLHGGWDFLGETTNGTNNYWGHNSEENGGYPFLAWQEYIQTCAPLCQVSDIVLSNIETNSITLESFNNLGYDGADGYVIYVNTEDTWLYPAEGDEPTSISAWQNAGQQCIYFGTSNNPNVTVTSLDVNTKYYFKVFAYNDCDGTETYENTGCFINQITKVPSTTPIGEGTESDPYQIANLENLAWLMYNDGDWDKHYIQTTDIDATTTVGWNSGAGFLPIGVYDLRFSGSYNGRGNAISNLYINRPTRSFVGFFGDVETGAIIDSLNMIGSDITGKSNVGSIAGCTRSATINCCFANGSVNGETSISVLVGHNTGIISNCFSSGSVTSTNYNSGGIAGSNGGNISNCYSNASVDGVTRVGGLVGANLYNKIHNCYSIGSVTGTISVGGLVGYQYNGVTSNSFWDILTSSQTWSAGGVGLTTAEMQNPLNHLGKGWDFMDEDNNGTNDFWGHNIAENNGYPFLKRQEFLNIKPSCQLPISSITGFMVNTINGISLNFEKFIPNGSDGYAVYINSSNSWNAPNDGDSPISSTEWKDNGQQCIYFGTSYLPNITITSLSVNTIYYFKVYGYIECGGPKQFESEGAEFLMETGPLKEAPIGSGTEGDPYQIANIANLYWLTQNTTEWNKHYVQTADIDVSEIKVWDDGQGFSPIGKKNLEFKGVYNGQNHTIDGLYINRPDDERLGLFGEIVDDSQIENLRVINIDITGKRWIGGIVGMTYNSKIINCFTSGTISASAVVGGLIGNSTSSYTKNSYSSVNVLSDNAGGTAGGFIGYAEGINDTIINCYSTGNVSGNSGIGGFLGGSWYSYIKNCYSTGNVSGNEVVGGFLGNCYGGHEGEVSFCYSNGKVTGTGDDIGGFVGDGHGSWSDITNCFWDIETSGQTTSSDGTGLTTEKMKQDTSFLNTGWDFICELTNGVEDVWGMNEKTNNGYPAFEWELQGPVPIKEELDTITDETSVTVTDYPEAVGFNGVTIIATTTSSLSYSSDGTYTIEWIYEDCSGKTTSQQQTVIIGSNSTDIKEVSEINVSIYPNPVNEILNISCNEQNVDRITIFDITGQTVVEKTNISNIERIDMSGFNAGIYFINIYNDKNIYSRKIVKN